MKVFSKPLNELVSELALSAVEIQRTLDRDQFATLSQFQEADVELLATLGLESLVAPALRVSEFRVGSQVSLRVTREKELVIAVRPINLGFRLTHRSGERTESRIEICIDRVPLPAPRQSPQAGLKTNLQATGAPGAASPEQQGGITK